MRLDLATAQARMSAACVPLRWDPDRVDWSRPTDEAINSLVAMPPQWRLDPARRLAIREVVDVLLGYAEHLAFVAGQADERKSAAALLRQQADRFERGRGSLVGELAQTRAGATCSELRTMASYIERGDRAEEK
jgi:hypothetical protein